MSNIKSEIKPRGSSRLYGSIGHQTE